MNQPATGNQQPATSNQQPATSNFLSYLSTLDIRLWAEGDRLRYNAPEKVMTPELLAQLRERKAEILECLKKTETVLLSRTRIQKTPDAEHYPVSHAQQRLWLLCQMGDDNNVAYNMPASLLFEGKLNRNCLTDAFNELIRRHESLRTSFIFAEGELRQQIQNITDFQIPYTELTAETNPEESARKKYIQEAMTPFDLEKAPLIRVSLIKLTQDRHIMLFNMHHIISDGWSSGVLIRETCRLYRAFCKGRSSPLPRLRIQYRDYAAWQNQLLKSGEMEKHRSYWLERLSGEIPALALPTDFPRPAVQSFKGNMLSFTLVSEHTEKLRIFSREQKVSLFMTLLASVKVLLCRYTGQEDIIVGSPIAGRNHADLEDQIGFYVNTLVLRDQVRSDESFLTFLKQIKQTATQAYDHQIYPFDKLTDDLKLRRDLSRSPLFDVLVIMQNNEPAELTLPGVRIEPLEQTPPISKFDLTFEFWEDKTELLINLKYNTDLFRKDRIERINTHFQELIRSILKDAAQPIWKLNILPETEYHQVLYEFNDTGRDYPRDTLITDLIEEQARRTPDAPAVIFEDRHFTYNELNIRANQLARRLKEMGAGPEVLIGIFMERSLEMAVSMYAVLKSGAAYIPLEPEYPSERLNFMIRDSRLSVLITQPRMSDRLDTRHIRLISLDADFSAIAHLPQENPERTAGTENSAYAVYTSGSSGPPKGVLNTHAGLMNQLYWRQEYFRLTPPDAVLQKTPFSFDNSVWELFWPLMVGAKTVLVPPGGHKDGFYLSKMIKTHRITTIHFVPSMLRLFLQVPGIETASRTLKRVFTGGEPLDRELQAQFFAELNAELYHLYGQSEAAMNVTCRACSRTDRVQGTVPVGKPVANTRIYILDARLNPCPIGVPGELYIGGRGLAKSYLSRPDLDAEKFVPNPFSIPAHPTPHTPHPATLYKTGDIGKWLPDGNIELAGRNDDQVKIRGYRIELGEVKSCLLKHEGVCDAAVLAIEYSDGKELAAYIVPQKDLDTPLNTSRLRDDMKKSLPDYMIPSYFIQLAEFPFTPSGKIDKKALPGPAQTSRTAEYVSPRNETERKLAAVWQEVLAIEQVGIRDNFFDLGGHSLKAAHLVSRMYKEFNREISMREIFTSPTVEELAKRIDPGSVSQGGEPFTPLACIQPHGKNIPLFFIHIARGDVFCYAELSRQLGSDYPFYGLRSFGVDADTSPVKDIKDMAAKYIEAVRAEYPSGPYIIGGHSRGGIIAYEMAQQLRNQSESVPLLIFIDAFSPDYIERPDDLWSSFLRVREFFDVDIPSFYCQIREIPPGLSIEDARKDFDSLSREEQTDVLWKASQASGLPAKYFPDIDTKLQYRIFKVSLESGQAVSRYNKNGVQPYLGRIVLFRASENWAVRDLVKQTDSDKTLGWSRYAADVEVYDIEGADHASIVQFPYVQLVSEKLKPCLESVQKEIGK
jgi:amino acid adenylation domain-containing protein